MLDAVLRGARAGPSGAAINERPELRQENGQGLQDRQRYRQGSLDGEVLLERAWATYVPLP